MIERLNSQMESLKNWIVIDLEGEYFQEGKIIGKFLEKIVLSWSLNVCINLFRCLKVIGDKLKVLRLKST